MGARDSPGTRMDGTDQLAGLVFGEMLKTLRKKKGVSQQVLAARLDLHRNTISKWERGECLPESRTLVLELARQLHLHELEARLLLEASLTTTLPYPWSLPYQRNPFFTGRETLLAQLHSLLAAEQATGLHTCLLYGLGGIGKTQLTIEYAYRYSLEYNAVLWLQAETYAALVASFATLADQLGLPECHSKQQYASIEAVRRWLCEHHGWLLIVDNLGDFAYIKHILPPARQGSVLFTTQRRYTGSFMQSIEVPPLTAREGARFLLRRTDMQAFATGPEEHVQENIEALEPLVQAMEGLPLALEQAASYIFSSQCGPQRYLSLLHAHPLALLSAHDSNADHALSVAATCTLAVEHVQKDAPRAVSLLALCAFLAPESLAEEMLRLLCSDPAIADLCANLATLSTDDLAWYEALAGLSNYSLARYEAHTRLLSIHRLVQTIVNATLAQ
jgi:transcriptional regulator with XRE-family HTH domain